MREEVLGKEEEQQARPSRRDPAVEGYEQRHQADYMPPEYLTYGTIGEGYHTARSAWTGLTHAWEIPKGARPTPAQLKRRPVELLAIERGYWKRPAVGEDLTATWRHMVVECPRERRPATVVETWPGDSALWKNGPMTKGTVTKWGRLGYGSRGRVLRATEAGGAIDQVRCLVIRTTKSDLLARDWPPLNRDERPRPMSNLLTPPGLVPRWKWKQAPFPALSKVTDPLDAPMPWTDGSRTLPWIKGQYGYRRLEWDEMGRGLGVSKTELGTHVSASLILGTTSVFHWEYVSQMLSPTSQDGTKRSPLEDTGIEHLSRFQTALATHTCPVGQDQEHSFKWRPPDLSPGGNWYQTRIKHLKAAMRRYPDQSTAIYCQGLECLEDHRLNYTEEGAVAKRPRILWWEFPPEHWDSLREGSSMHYLCSPKQYIHENSAMTSEQTAIASDFVDELVDLGILNDPPKGMEVKTTIPLFLVPKPGQPDQWRVIADAKAGGQNECSAPDPVYLNKASHILDQLYEGGWSSVVDASKFFYQFRTRREDQPHLGMVHPRDGHLLVYTGLPMGASPSPAHAGRYGLAFLRLLKEEYGEYQGEPTANCWWSGFCYQGYDPKMGYGYLWKLPDGAGVVKIFVHVDDFLLHGPTEALTALALTHFLDMSVNVGLLCHPGKLKPPSQVQLYVGFYFDTRGIPMLRVPEDKREKAHGMVNYVLSRPDGHQYSRLALSVLTGTLESLVEATPARVGRTYLRYVYDDLHTDCDIQPSAKYYSKVGLTAASLEDLGWWRHLLSSPLARRARGHRSATLVPTFGDGSGTGTGGTIQLEGSPLSLWMGAWSQSSFLRTSNWKELKTLLITLQALKANHSDRVEGATLFYFTDNSGTYWISEKGSSRSPGLHRLIRQVKLLELELDVDLQVVHVPGLVMISQGTDGLSRGIWTSLLHETVDQQRLNAAIFAPTAPDWGLIRRVAPLLGLDSIRWQESPWEAPLPGKALLHRGTVYFPPPELAQANIVRFLEAWVESAHDTCAIFVVPRVVTSRWRNLSRYVQEWGEIPASDLNNPPVLPIPIVILYVLPHVRMLPPRRERMDPNIPAKLRKAHEREVEALRGLSADD